MGNADIDKYGRHPYNCRGGDSMADTKPDYREMYLSLFRASEEALDILIAAQRKCEKMYLSVDGKETVQAEERAGE